MERLMHTPETDHKRPPDQVVCTRSTTAVLRIVHDDSPGVAEAWSRVLVNQASEPDRERLYQGAAVPNAGGVQQDATASL